MIHRSRIAEDSTPMPYDSIVATVLTMLLTPHLGIVHVANLAGGCFAESVTNEVSSIEIEQSYPGPHPRVSITPLL
jgi:hypothetical protein